VNRSSSNEDGLKLRQRFKSATRDAILQAAARVFAADGAAKARVEDIATEAGIAVGTVYNYFQDRTALVTALLETRTRALLDALDAVETGTSVDVERDAIAAFHDRLGRFVTALAAHFDVNHPLLSAILDDERQRGVDARTATRRQTIRQEVLGRAERLIASGIRARAVQEGDPAIYAALLVGMVRGMGMSVLARQERFAGGANEIVRIFLHGVGR
jgi:AcrR family transcriptional regulator